MIKERVLQVLEYKHIAKEQFFKRIGMSSANFRGKAKNTPLNSNAVEHILTEIPDLNPGWLITGIGEMLKTNNQSISGTQRGTGNNINSNINGVNGNVTISQNDFSALIELQKGHQKFEKELLDRLETSQANLHESQHQINQLLEALKNKS